MKDRRRGALHLALLLRLGELTAVRVPNPAEEAACDPVRAREDARTALMRTRHRLSKLLLRDLEAAAFCPTMVVGKLPLPAPPAALGDGFVAARITLRHGRLESRGAASRILPANGEHGAKTHHRAASRRRLVPEPCVIVQFKSVFRTNVALTREIPCPIVCFSPEGQLERIATSS